VSSSYGSRSITDIGGGLSGSDNTITSLSSSGRGGLLTSYRRWTFNIKIRVSWQRIADLRLNVSSRFTNRRRWQRRQLRFQPLPIRLRQRDKLTLNSTPLNDRRKYGTRRTFTSHGNGSIALLSRTIHIMAI